MSDPGRVWGALWADLHAVEASADRDTLRRLEAARRYLEDHALRGPSLAEIARRAHLSPAHFHRLFHAHYGLTPHRWVSQTRLGRARTLLRETDLPVTEICVAVGFESLGSFSARFHRDMGEPPSAWRRRWVRSGWVARPPVPACFLSRYS